MSNLGVVTSDILTGLPQPVRRYLEFSGVLGRPIVHTATVRQTGRIRTGPDKAWMCFRATESYSLDPAGFVWSAVAAYAWTRNPMLLCTLALLLAVGLRFRSLWFVLWVILVVSPAWIFFVTIYEERELEIRFGEAYRQYRAKTALLFPRRPRGVMHVAES